MQIRFQQSDLAVLETHPLTPGLTLLHSSSVTATAVAIAGATAVSVTAEAGTTPSTFTTEATPQSTIFSTTSPSISPNATSNVPTVNVSPSAKVDVPGRGLASQDSLDPGLIALVVLVSVAAVLALLLVLYKGTGSNFHSWRTSPARRPSGAVQVGLGAWIGKRPDNYDIHPGNRVRISIQTLDDVIIDRSPIGITEFEKSLGSRQNPAELEANEIQRLSQRASWVSRMLSKVAHSSISTRSSSRSRWTQRSVAHTGDWEMFVQGKAGTVEEDEDGLAKAAMAHPRSIAASSYEEDDDKALGSFSTYLELPPKVRTFDRLSQGTFGRVIVRSRSFDSPNHSGVDSRGSLV